MGFVFPTLPSQTPTRETSAIPCWRIGESHRLWLVRWLLPVCQAPIESAFLLSENDQIAALGAFSELPEDWQHAFRNEMEEVFQHDYLLSPGLINAHTHLEQSIGKTLRLENPKQPDMAKWLISAKPHLDALWQSETLQQEALERGIQELTASGTTFVNDISRYGTSLVNLDRAGLRGIVSLEFFHPNTQTLIEPLLLPTFENYCELFSRYADNSRLAVGLSPHSPYNVSPIAWQWMLDKANAFLSQQGVTDSCLIHTHLAESQAETDYIANKKSPVDDVHQAFVGKTFGVSASSSSPVQYLARHALLTPKLMAAHGIYTDAQDRADLKSVDASILHCPRSNFYLQGETLSLKACRDSGTPIALGTDGHLSTPGLDIRAEARHARIFHGLTAPETLSLITQDAANAIAGESGIGCLKPGFQADMALWKPGKTVQNHLPEEQVLSPESRCIGLWVNAMPIKNTKLFS